MEDGKLDYAMRIFGKSTSELTIEETQLCTLLLKIKEEDRGFIKMLKFILWRPAMYGIKDIDFLWVLIFGYNTAASNKGDDHFFDINGKFTEYVNRYFTENYGVKYDGGLAWNGIIREHVKQHSKGSIALDGWEGLKLFDKLFFEFYKQIEIK